MRLAEIFRKEKIAPAQNIGAKKVVISAISVYLREIEAFYVAIFPRRKECPLSGPFMEK
ncbi:hypothetical protein HMSSN036_10660 [Paenibacillus macerans]|nr:hypothetical protein HMSSN036_10660 [Paenibacillus macerans]